MGAIPTVYSKDSPLRTMTRIALYAKIAPTASPIYLANNSLSYQLSILGRFFNLADKFMTKRSFETRIPARDLKIGVANAGLNYPNQCLTISNRVGDVGQSQFPLLEP
jgi:hypothetical protein